MTQFGGDFLIRHMTHWMEQLFKVETRQNSFPGGDYSQSAAVAVMARAQPVRPDFEVVFSPL